MRRENEGLCVMTKRHSQNVSIASLCDWRMIVSDNLFPFFGIVA